ncbi:hypothetical protein [Mesorhizobium amorphae]|uniref:hypothetical protein n=1 Tax=Mesorhizobium amorphae TaxID=71433 RepID=UPI0021B45B8E|nr:hypothetical protein [Mesorhizobium amorphae]
MTIADNRLDGPTALANAQSFVQRSVDYVIEFQTDVNFGPQVMNVFNQDGVKVAAIDIPMAGATFFGANNPKSGFMGGSYLGQAAIAKFGADKVKQGTTSSASCRSRAPFPRCGPRASRLASCRQCPTFRKTTCCASTPRTPCRNPSRR